MMVMFSALLRLIKLLLPCRAPPSLNGKPNICLPPAAALEGSPWPKTKRGTFLFVWGSCSAMVSPNPLMIGLVGCVSPSQTEGWRWLIGWFIQSSLDFWGSGGGWVSMWGLRKGVLSGGNLPGSSGSRLPPSTAASPLSSSAAFHKHLWCDYWTAKFWELSSAESTVPLC